MALILSTAFSDLFGAAMGKHPHPFHFGFFPAHNFLILDILRQLRYGAGGFSYKSFQQHFVCLELT